MGMMSGCAGACAYATGNSGAGNGLARRDLDRNQQQELLAPVAVARHTNRDDERVAEGQGLGKYPCAVDASARIRLRTTFAPSS